jgi:predicted aldo/keto reductase-like oxidoreductase
VIHKALDYGINFIDTSPIYTGGRAEGLIGGVMRSRRDEVILATGWYPGGRTGRQELLRSLDRSLARLKTDRVDVIFTHNIHDPSTLENEEIHEAYRIAREAGKVRFHGLTTHAERQEEIIDWGISDGRLDVVMFAFNFARWPRLPAVLEKANKAGIGLAAMKTLAGGKSADLTKYRADGSSLARAALRWTLSNPDITTALIGITSFEQLDDYVGASGGRLSRLDLEEVNNYVALVKHTYCRPNCGECSPACPHGVAIPEILRYRMYAENYRLPSEARRKYAKLDEAGRPNNCADCPAPCESACPYGLAVRDRVVEADRILRA